MAANLFRYYDDGWKTEIFTCPTCGWQGTFEEGLVEMYEALMDSSCPVCPWGDAPMLAIVSWPTMDEMRENWAKVSPEDKAGFHRRERFLAMFDEMSLKTADQLPDLDDPAIVITWDYVEGDDDDCYTVLKHGEQEIWREPAVYEGYERFGEIAELLLEKYGKRIVDLIPTSASGTFLYGDKLGSIGAVKSARERIQSAQKK